MHDHIVPLFQLLEAGPFVEEAFRIETTYRLSERWNQRESGCLLGEVVGPLMNHQVTYLLETAISRLIDNLPHVPGPKDFYVHHVIHHLYRTYTHRFLRSELQRDAKLEALLTRLAERNLSHRHNFEFASMPPAQWELMVDLGQVLLEREFPVGLKSGPLQNIACRDYGQPHTWLGDLWQKLQEDTAAEALLVAV
jgi:hypothetical protein